MQTISIDKTKIQIGVATFIGLCVVLWGWATFYTNLTNKVDVNQNLITKLEERVTKIEGENTSLQVLLADVKARLTGIETSLVEIKSRLNEDGK